MASAPGSVYTVEAVSGNEGNRPHFGNETSVRQTGERMMREDKRGTIMGRFAAPPRQWKTILTALAMMLGSFTANGAEKSEKSEEQHVPK